VTFHSLEEDAMTARSLRPLVASLAVCTSLSCSDPAAVQDFFVLITNSWEVVGDEDHRFEFTADEFEGEAGATEGTFTGTELIDENDFTGSELTGSWSDNQIEFTVRRSAGNLRFTAPVTRDLPTELTITSAPDPDTGQSETYTIRRQ
jgi:hypothetical protein